MEELNNKVGEVYPAFPIKYKNDLDQENKYFTTEKNFLKPSKVNIIGAMSNFSRNTKVDLNENINKLGLNFTTFNIIIASTRNNLQRGDILKTRINNEVEKCTILFIKDCGVQMGENEAYTVILYAENENDYLDIKDLVPTLEWTLMGNNKTFTDKYYRNMVYNKHKYK